MIQEEKDLLLKDLCARLPYGTKVRAFIGEKGENDEILGCVHIFNFYSHNCKPYLRPMSSMTEEENNERKQLGILCAINSNHEKIFDGFGNESVDTQLKALDWLNAHHFDYRGLIEKGLALEAPKDMYDNTK